jgi:RNA polymerase sigma-70 factor (ECF subfamily)
MNDQSDEQLVAAAREGDERAFMEIVKRHEARVASTVIGMLGNCPEAEDVGQETFIRFYRALGSFRGESGLGTYLTRIAINLSLNELKRRKKLFTRFAKKPVDEFHDIADRNSTGMAFEEKEILDKAMKSLKPEFRSVVVLRLITGYSTEETAKILNLPVGTVLSRLARAQKKLRELLAPCSGEHR